jgi:guanylate kinase
VDGKSYHFISMDQFEKMIEEDKFIEHAKFGKNRYGTSIAAIEAIAKEGKTCILDIEMEGVKQVASHKNFPRPRFLFLKPPSFEVLEKRLRGRGTDDEAAIKDRLEQARKEMEFADSGEAPHDLIVVNDNLDKAYEEVQKFIVGK